MSDDYLNYGDNMLQTQLQRISDQIGPPVATDDETSLTCPKARVAPPPLFCPPRSSGDEDDSFDDTGPPTPNYEMKTFVPKRWNSETYFSFPVDRIAFRHLFKLFARYGNPNKATEAMTLTSSDKWLRQAKVIDGRRITTIDTGIYFRQLGKNKKTMNIKEYEKYLDFIASKKGIDPDQIKYMLTTCGMPKPTVKGKTSSSEDDHVEWTREYRITGKDLRPRFFFPQRNLGGFDSIFDNEDPRDCYGYRTENVFCRVDPLF